MQKSLKDYNNITIEDLMLAINYCGNIRIYTIVFLWLLMLKVAKNT